MASRPDYVDVDEESLEKNSGQSFELEIDYHEFLGSYKLVYGTFGGERIIAKVEARDDVEKESIKACFKAEKIFKIVFQRIIIFFQVFFLKNCIIFKNFRIISETKNRPPFHGRICIMQAFYEVDSSGLTEIFS